MGANEIRHVLDMTGDLAHVLALELYTAAQALDYRRDMINAARRLAQRGDLDALCSKISNAPAKDSPDYATFRSECAELLRQLAAIDAFFRSTAEGVAYVYVPELDQAAHQFGVASPQWVRRLEDLDGFVFDLCSRLSPRDGLIVTADHGVLDVPVTRHRIIPGDSPLFRDVVTGGEPRCLHLYSERDSTELASAWRTVEESHAFVATRAEAIAAGWFGTVTPAHASRIGDVVVIPRHQAVYYDERTATTQSMAMIGQHGGLSRTETHVPLVRAGLFA